MKEVYYAGLDVHKDGRLPPCQLSLLQKQPTFATGSPVSRQRQEGCLDNAD
jgi:hypothetical protein